MKNQKTAISRLLSLALVICMLAGLLSVQVLAYGDGHGTEVVEIFENEPLENVAVLPDSTGGSLSDTVTVVVQAADKITGNPVAVSGATVRLKVDGKELRTAISGSDGKAYLSLAGLTYEEKMRATVSADTVISRGKATTGTGRDKLYNEYYPKTINPSTGEAEYYRYTMELHSEKIDASGNWVGEKIPSANITGKVDMVFAIDTTGSMGDEIANVKRNILNFAQSLIDKGLDIRFCIIEYLDITTYEMTYVYKVNGSHWYSDAESVVEVLDKIKLGNGGDGPETPLDALGYIANANEMSYRSDAHKFAFLLTDADYKNNNSHGYKNITEVANALARQNIVTSVISPSNYKSTYQTLFNTTGGIWANIYASDFRAEMLTLAESIADTVEREEIVLTLSEPRMLVNLSVCYFGNDKTSTSESYKQSLKNMLSEYSKQLAQSTDGHVYVDKIILLHTSNRLDFYNTSKVASMCDLRIESEINDDGKWLSNVKIHNNAYISGFYSANTVTVDNDYVSRFQNLKNPGDLVGKKTFYRIVSGGVDINGYNFIDDMVKFAKTQVHETGHYLFGFFDEYLDANGNNRNDSGSKKNGLNFGLMDWQYTDSELSKAKDYPYANPSTGLTTYQYWRLGASCEDTLAKLLTQGDVSLTYIDIFDGNAGVDNFYKYKITYTKSNNDRYATYSYAALDSSDFISTAYGGTRSVSMAALYVAAELESVVSTSRALGRPSFVANGDYVEFELVAISGYEYKLYVMGVDDEEFKEIPLSASGDTYTALLNIGADDMAEIRLTAKTSGIIYGNNYYIDRSDSTDSGYMYISADNCVMAYVLSDEETGYMFIADNTSYSNGEYVSVNQATIITSDADVDLNGGEIYSVASYMAEIDYTTLSWFKYKDGVWTKLDTVCSEEENMNLSACANIDSEGIYVLMAKKASVGGADKVTNIEYTTSKDKDAVVTITFTDKNSNVKYYNVYYSDTMFTDKNAEGVITRTYSADSTELTLDLIERGRAVYVAIEVVLEDGTRSELSNLIVVEAGEADSDNDGIPDWFCDKYLLWGAEGESKDIAKSDDDGDGLTNLQEYMIGSDPTNPNDPAHTTNVPVDGITVSESNIVLGAGDKRSVTAVVLPANASNKNVRWSLQYEGVVSIKADGSVCEITGLAEGTTKIYVVTADGGYSAVIEVTVKDHVHVNNKKVYVRLPGVHRDVCDTCGETFTEEAHIERLINVEEATCSKEGYTGDIICDICLRVLGRGESIPKTGHTRVVVGVKEATCISNGYTGDTVCPGGCGIVYIQGKTIPATGHNTTVVNAKEATCSKEGYTGDSVCLTCERTVSKGQKIPTTAHTEKTVGVFPATCMEEGYSGDVICEVCSTKVRSGETLPKTSHKEKIINAKDATCMEEGYTGDKVCAVCYVEISDGDVIPRGGHNPTIANAKEATCTEAGYTGDNICEGCGEIIEAGRAIPATGHVTHKVNDKSATETEEGYTGDIVCENCNAVIEEGEVIPVVSGGFGGFNAFTLVIIVVSVIILGITIMFVIIKRRSY